MAWFLVRTRYIPDKVAQVRPQHREYLSTLAAAGSCKLGGPLADGSGGGVMIFEAADEDALRALLDADPYHLQDALAERWVQEFNPALGAWFQ